LRSGALPFSLRSLQSRGPSHHRARSKVRAVQYFGCGKVRVQTAEPRSFLKRARRDHGFKTCIDAPMQFASRGRQHESGKLHSGQRRIAGFALPFQDRAPARFQNFGGAQDTLRVAGCRVAAVSGSRASNSAKNAPAPSRARRSRTSLRTHSGTAGICARPSVNALKYNLYRRRRSARGSDCAPLRARPVHRSGIAPRNTPHARSHGREIVRCARKLRIAGRAVRIRASR